MSSYPIRMSYNFAVGRQQGQNKPLYRKLTIINYYFLLHYNMSLIGSVSGFAAFGVLVRTYALGLQKRPVFSSEYC
jgi:hypothetical protein